MYILPPTSSTAQAHIVMLLPPDAPNYTDDLSTRSQILQNMLPNYQQGVSDSIILLTQIIFCHGSIIGDRWLPVPF